MIPNDHSQRVELNDELHARPPETLNAPLRLTYLALLSDWNSREDELAHISDLAQRFDAPLPAPGASHYSQSLGVFRLKWERHAEFSRYKFIVSGDEENPFLPPAVSAAPGDWVATLKGEVMVATHVAILSATVSGLDHEAIGARWFGGNTLVGSTLASGAGIALTDFRIHCDGFGRLLVINHGMTPRQTGRMVQRLVEIDTYRMMALLAFPIARKLAPELSRSELELARISGAMATAGEHEEPILLDKLTRLAAEIDSSESKNYFRFRAAAAYYELVQRRIAELREERIAGLQTFQEFTERRLAPAMNTCRAVAERLGSLSARVARTTQLLSTRVDVTRERQNQAILASMNRRARLQLRLQETVEGLSLVAVTYYVAGLVGYIANAAKASGAAINPSLFVALSIPVTVVLVALAVRRIRKTVTRRTIDPKSDDD